MNDLFRSGPLMPRPMALGERDSSRRPNWGETRWDEALENGLVPCDPEVDPNCPTPWSIRVTTLGDHSFRGDPSSRQSPPTEKCNPAWDPGCPRPLPQMTVVPYLPSSYLQGSEIVYSRADARPRPRDRSGRVF